MKKLIFLLVLSVLVIAAFGQTPFTAVYTFPATQAAPGPTTMSYNGTSYTGLNFGDISKVGVTSSESNNNFRATTWPTGAISGSDTFSGLVNTGKYIAFTISPTSGYKFTINTITFGVGRSGTGTRQSQWRGSADSYESIINTYTNLASGITNTDGVLTNTDANSSWTGNILTLGTSYANQTSQVGLRYYLYNAELASGTAGLQGPITITGTFESIGGSAPPALTADTTDNNVDNNIDITFTDSSAWRAVITAVKVGGTALTNSTDYVITAGNIQLKPSGGNTLLRTSGTKSVTVEATGYSTATVSQVISTGAVSIFTATTVSDLIINQTRVVTCTATDQYSNSVAGYQFKYDVAITDNNATTDESYTVDGTAITSSITGQNVTSLTNASGVATFSITIPADVDGGDGISVQVLRTDGTTAVGTAKTYYRVQSAPTVTSPTATSISASSAVLGANITNDGLAAITHRGTVWKASSGVTIDDNYLVEGGITTGVFSHSRTDLPPNTTIYYRGFARNSMGTTLSDEASFVTPKLEPANHVSNLTAALSSPAWSSIKLDWTDTVADGYLIKGSSIGFNDINPPADGTPEVNATLVINVNQGLETYTFTSLGELTTYYFKIFPYTNSGTIIDYRTAATVPQVQVQTADGPDVIAGWDFEDADKRVLITNAATWTSNPYTADSGIAANKDISSITLAGAPTWNAWGTVLGSSQPSSTRWNDGNGSKYWQIQISTAGYRNVNISSKQKSSNTGPRDFTIQYSTNGSTWADTDINITVANDDFVSGVVNNTALPSACGNQSSLYLRWIMTSNTSVNNATVQSGGTSRIDDIVISGYAYDYPEDVPVVASGVTLTMTNGNANSSSTPATGAPNGNFVSTFTRVLTLLGAGPWNITLSGSVETMPWFAYRKGTNWTSLANLTGSVSFEVTASKDTEIEIQGGSGENPTLPVELSSFTYTLNGNNLVTLQWITQTETNVLGYYIYRGKSEEASEAVLVSDMIAATNTSTLQSYIFVDSELQEQGTYYYWLQNLDMDGSNAFHGPVRVEYNFTDPGTPNQPLVTALNRVYPNPFNPTTFINYSLSENSPVQFKIYNNRGQLVRTLTNVPTTAGNHRVDWNGTDENGSACSTGLYLIRMEAGKESFTRKVVLVK